MAFVIWLIHIASIFSHDYISITHIACGETYATNVKLRNIEGSHFPKKYYYTFVLMICRALSRRQL